MGGVDVLKELVSLFFGAKTTEGITSVLGFVDVPSRGRVGVEEIVVEEPIDDSSSIVD